MNSAIKIDSLWKFFDFCCIRRSFHLFFFKSNELFYALDVLNYERYSKNILK